MRSNFRLVVTVNEDGTITNPRELRGRALQLASSIANTHGVRVMLEHASGEQPNPLEWIEVLYLSPDPAKR